MEPIPKEIPKEIKSGNETFIQPSHQAQAFAIHFKTKVEKVVNENQINHHVNNGRRLVECANHNFFTHELIYEILLSLKNKTCFGSDIIPLKVLKDGVNYLAQPILKLMNLIYDQNHVPEQWKMEKRIIPLHKKVLRPIEKTIAQFQICAQHQKYLKKPFWQGSCRLRKKVTWILQVLSNMDFRKREAQ